jgi:hypothetical protein
MPEISDQNTPIAFAETACLGKLLDDSNQGAKAHGQATTIEHAHPGNSCLEFPTLSGLEPEKISGLWPAPGPGESQTSYNQIGDSISGDSRTVEFNHKDGLRPYVGLASSANPGQPLAFDANLQRLEFSPPATPAWGQPNLGNLSFDYKLSPSLVFGVNMKF